MVIDSEDTVKAVADALGKHGFVNYFGMQVIRCHSNESIYLKKEKKMINIWILKLDSETEIWEWC